MPYIIIIITAAHYLQHFLWSATNKGRSLFCSFFLSFVFFGTYFIYLGFVYRFLLFHLDLVFRFLFALPSFVFHFSFQLVFAFHFLSTPISFFIPALPTRTQLALSSVSR